MNMQCLGQAKYVVHQFRCHLQVMPLSFVSALSWALAVGAAR
jgi:hypothetical protein